MVMVQDVQNTLLQTPLPTLNKRIVAESNRIKWQSGCTIFEKMTSDLNMARPAKVKCKSKWRNYSLTVSIFTQCGTKLNGVVRPFSPSMKEGTPNAQIVTIGALNLCANINRLSAKNSSFMITSKCKSVLWIKIWTFRFSNVYRLLNLGKVYRAVIVVNTESSPLKITSLGTEQNEFKQI